MLYRFANCLLDTSRHVFERGGEAVHVEPQVFDLLVCLAGSGGGLVSHEALLATVWKGLNVSDGTISARMNVARKAVGDDGKAQRIIETVARRGFRLAAPVTVETGDASSARQQAEPASAPATLPTLAVLPFRYQTAYPLDTLADGVVDDITMALSRVGEFHVIARQSAVAFRDTSDVRAAARLLGAEYLVEGSIQRVGNRVRIAVNLLDAQARTIWSSRYDETLDHLFELQDRIAEQVAGQLPVKLLGAEIARANTLGKGVDEARAWVLRALPHFWVHERDANDLAIQHLSRALEVDGDEVRAMAYKAWALAQRPAYLWSGDAGADRAEAQALASRAAAHAYDDAPVLISAPASLPAPSPVGPGAPAPCVGRGRELEALAAALAAAEGGARAVVLLSGEAGAGKTRLADSFVAGLAGRRDFWVARGQCAPHHGSREPFGPLLEAMADLVREDGAAGGAAGAALRRLLAEAAPSWLVQLPALFAPGEVARAQVALAGSGPDRMRRELSDLLERLTAEAPGVLVLEDLHWADASTLDWLGAWTLRRGPARLLVLGTARSDEPSRQGDEAAAFATLLRELPRRPGVGRLTLAGLDATAVAAYLAAHLPGEAVPSSLAADLWRRTEGHALFVAAVVEEWAARGIGADDESGAIGGNGALADLLARVPARVEAFIGHQVARLARPERALLEAASVAGPTFSAAALGGDGAEAAGAKGAEAAEAGCEDLARRGLFLVRAGTARWPDGTVAGTYAFRHGLHQEALYEAMPPAAREAWHRRVGLRLESGHKTGSGAVSTEVVPVLADHFERGRDGPRAVLYRRLSGEAALGRGAAREAAAQLRAALALVASCPPDPARDRAELATLMSLGGALIAADGFTAPGLAEGYARARALADGLSDPRALASALYGLWNYHLTRAEIAVATDLAVRLEALAEDLGDDRTGDPGAAVLRMCALNAAGHTHWLAGRPELALPFVERVAALYNVERHAAAAAAFGEDPGLVCHQYGAIVHELAGDAVGAERRLNDGLAIAAVLRQPFGTAQMLWGGAVVARLRGDAGLAGVRARALLAACEAGDTRFWEPSGEILAGWAGAMAGDAGGLAEIRRGMNAWASIQMALTRPFSLAALAEASGALGRPAEGLAAATEALGLAEATGETWHLPAIRRLVTDLAAQAGAGPDSAEEV